MNLELDHKNHQWILHYHHLKRKVDYKDESQLEKIRLELIEEFRNEQIKKILDNEEDSK